MKLLIASLCLIPFLAQAAWVVKSTESEQKGVQVENVQWIDKKISKPVVLREGPEFIVEHSNFKSPIYKEVMYPDNKLPKGLMAFKKAEMRPIDGEVRTIIKQGKDSDRITITILGDGYTEAEKEKFFDDVRRMVDDMFVEVTFKSYLGMFNIYAVFVASEDSGITDRQRKDTVFELYRSPIGSKRGIMPGNRSNIERALDLVNAYTNYPIIIANDDFYGGLGGRYAITTRSLTSGTMVLRHELGHNFGNVGEEYDGGQVYSGANFSRNPKSDWPLWMQRQDVLHKNEFLNGYYLWQNLKKPFKTTFKFNKRGYQLGMKLSSVGWDTENDVEVLVNGQKVEINGTYTADRSFFRTARVPLEPGTHTLEIRQKIADGNNVLAYANVYAYPASYDFESGDTAGFSVFNNSRRFMGYRPTENKCLMRDMRSKVFCEVDQENIWFEFLKRVDLIDEVKVSADKVELKTPQIDHLDIRWYDASESEIVELRGKKSWSKAGRSSGNYSVVVKLKTPEIRKNLPSHTTTRESFNL